MSIIKLFNRHFTEFIDDIMRVFPKDKHIRTARLFIVNINRINPKLVIKYWKVYITDLYGPNIREGDISFFIEKNYDEDVGTSDQYNGTKLLGIIELIRVKVRSMGKDNQIKTIKYLQNLTKLSSLYFKTFP